MLSVRPIQLVGGTSRTVIQAAVPLVLLRPRTHPTRVFRPLLLASMLAPLPKGRLSKTLIAGLVRRVPTVGEVVSLLTTRRASRRAQLTELASTEVIVLLPGWTTLDIPRIALPLQRHPRLVLALCRLAHRLAILLPIQ